MSDLKQLYDAVLNGDALLAVFAAKLVLGLPQISQPGVQLCTRQLKG